MAIFGRPAAGPAVCSNRQPASPTAVMNSRMMATRKNNSPGLWSMCTVCGNHHFTGLADCAFASPGLADPVCRLADIWNGIGNSQGQAGPAHDRQIGQVVPHESGLFGADAEFGQQCLEVNQLISAVEINMLDTERVQPRGDRRGRPAADDSRGDARALQTLQAQTILDAHGFDLFVMGTQVQLAVSRHTVDIKDYDPIPGRLLLDSIGSHVHITFAFSRSCIFSAPTV